MKPATSAGMNRKRGLVVPVFVGAAMKPATSAGMNAEPLANDDLSGIAPQ